MSADDWAHARALEFLQPDHPHYVDVRFAPASAAGGTSGRSAEVPGILTSIPIETDDRTGRRTVLKLSRADADKLTNGQRLTTKPRFARETSSWRVNSVQPESQIFSEVVLGP